MATAGTAAVFTLLEMESRDSSISGNDEPGAEGTFQIGGRSPFDCTLTVGALDSGVSVTCVVETSPDGDDDTWTELTNFDGAKTATGTTSKTSLSIPAGHKVMKGRISSISGGEAWVEISAEAPFLDPTVQDDKDLLGKELRQFSDGLNRIVEQAEEDVLHQAIGVDRFGHIDADLMVPQANDRMRRAIARQADYLLRKHKLERASDETTLGALERMGELADGIDVILRPMVDNLMVWRGRGSVNVEARRGRR